VIAGLGLIVGGAAAGAFGSLLGLGGGILIVPLLTLGFGLPLREAVGVSLVSVIVTSSASASVYLQRHVANLRLGMTLEMFTAMGALLGGLLAFLLDERTLAGLFAALLIYVAISMVRRSSSEPADEAGATGYRIQRAGLGYVGSIFAGVVSALLGIGGGLVKVPVMHLIMGVPLRVATATSNLMIGITASASAIIYLFRGGIDPYVAGPVAVGVFVGASVGSRTAHRIDLRVLRVLFVLVLAYTAFEMTRKALLV
jgi:uncharacterized membrane protein YfcA